MRRSLLGSLVLAVCAFPVVAGSLELPANPRTQPMQFSQQQEGPAADCTARCRRLVFAAGMITADTPRRFEAFARAHDIDGATLVLDSDGGSVRGALALGRLIRGYRLDTTVGRRIDNAAAGSPAPQTAAIAPANCESMCAFVLLGGARRTVPPKSRVLVHQIWLGDRRDDAVAADYSAEDVSLVQRDIGQIVRYTSDMGGSAELIELSLRIPPWEPMRALARDELQRMRLDLGAEAVDAAGPATTAAVPVAYGVASEPAAAAHERGWAVVEEKGAPAYLARRHPLTHEGERIGSFDLLLGCSAQPGGPFSVTYVERRGPMQSGRLARVEQVRMWIGDSEIPFRLVSSDNASQPRQAETVATAAITSALLHDFASTARQSLSVLTRSVGQPTTWIRIGNSGFSQNLPQFEARCSEQAAPRLDAHARLEAR